MSSVRERRKGLGWSRADLAGRAALDPRIIQLVELDQWSEDDALWRINEVLSRAEAGEPEVQLAPVVAPQG
jgi:ribosome-binding protein aMBF1 (putative translation factor)